MNQLAKWEENNSLYLTHTTIDDYLVFTHIFTQYGK